jgi:hypothetical protein
MTVHRRPGASRRRGETHRRRAGQGASEASWVSRQLWRAWRARIWHDGRNVHLGYFSTSGAAKDAHAEAVRARLGDAYLMEHGGDVPA